MVRQATHQATTSQAEIEAAARTGSGAAKTITLGLAGISTLALGFAAGPAAAQQGVGNLFAAPARDPFNTFSVGVGGGYDIFKSSGEVYSQSTIGIDEGAGPFRGHGGFGTVEIGRDFRFGQTVLGIYGDYSFGHKQDSVYNVIQGLAPPIVGAAAAAPPAGPGEMVTEVGLRLDNSHAVIARLGHIVSPTTLVYGLFGYTWHSYHAWATVDDGDYDASLTATKAGQLGGLTFGLGAEAMVTSNWSLKGEYRFVKMGRIDDFSAVSGPLFVSASMGKVDDHVFRFVASYKLP